MIGVGQVIVGWVVMMYFLTAFTGMTMEDRMELSSAIVLWVSVFIALSVLGFVILVLDRRKYTEAREQREHEINMKQLTVLEADASSEEASNRHKIMKLEREIESIKHVAGIAQAKTARGQT